MSADAIIYCLEQATDYRDFERLCSALLEGMGYLGIDPLGGTGDEGRDAIIRDDATGRKIAFAYTVRADWRAKLAHDCHRVQEAGHAPDVFVFVCTETLAFRENGSLLSGHSEPMDYKAVLAACEDKQVGGAMADAVDKLFAKDHRNLKNDTGERAIADMLAVYLRHHFEGHDANVEYNRMGDSPKEVTWRIESGGWS